MKTDDMITIPADYVKDITLLSVEEAEELPLKILEFPTWCWLRSQGHGCSYGAIVRRDGSVYFVGSPVYYDFYGIRPVLIINNLESHHFKVGDMFKVFDEEWCYIGKDKVLAKSLDLNAKKNTPFYAGIDWCEFWKKYQFEDSTVYKLLKDWLEEKKFIDDCIINGIFSSYDVQVVDKRCGAYNAEWCEEIDCPEVVSYNEVLNYHEVVPLQWHIVKDESSELPIKRNQYIIAMRDDEKPRFIIAQCQDGKFNASKYFGTWLDSYAFSLDEVVAWAEIPISDELIEANAKKIKVEK